MSTNNKSTLPFEVNFNAPFSTIQNWEFSLTNYPLENLLFQQVADLINFVDDKLVEDGQLGSIESDRIDATTAIDFLLRQNVREKFTVAQFLKCLDGGQQAFKDLNSVLHQSAIEAMITAKMQALTAQFGFVFFAPKTPDSNCFWRVCCTLFIIITKK